MINCILNNENETISVIKDFVYLGVKFSYNTKFIKSYNYINKKGNKTLFAKLRKARQLNLLLDLTSQLFDSVVLPVLMYGEVSAPYPSTETEKVHLKFCKYLLSAPNKTTDAMVYAELGRMPLEIKIKTKTLFFSGASWLWQTNKIYILCIFSFLCYILKIFTVQNGLHSS